MKISICPRCGKDGIKTGVTPLPDGNGEYEQYQCHDCGHGFLIRDEGVGV